MNKLNSHILALHVQVLRALFSSDLGVSDPVVFDGRLEVVMHGGCNPDDSTGIHGSGGRDEEGVEESNEEEVAENVRAELEIEFLGCELVDGRNHHPSVFDQHVQLGFLPRIRE